MQKEIEEEIRDTLQEIQHAMGVSKGMDMFRQRIKMATRKKFSPGEKDAAKFYVDQMKDSLEKSSLGIDFRDQNRMCDDYAEKMEKKKKKGGVEEEKKEETSTKMDKGGGVEGIQHRKDLMRVHELALMLPPVSEISEHYRQRGKARFHWIGKGRMRHGFLVQSFLQVAKETSSEDKKKKHKGGFGFFKGKGKKKKRSDSDSTLSSSKLIFRDIISEFKARFQSLSRKDGDQKIICDGRVITLISPSDFKNVLMYVVFSLESLSI